MPKKTQIPGWPEGLTHGLPAFPNPLLNLDLSNNPMTNSLTGGFDFVKGLWGGLPSAVPGFVVPTVDLEELDKRITDLKAVESWLAMNANMLRATVQSLEVQRNTVAALQAMGSGFTSSNQEMFKGSKDDAPAARSSSFANWPKSEPAPEDLHPEAQSNTRSAPQAPVSGKRAHGASRAPGRTEKGAAVAESGAAANWLSLLQAQFNQIAQAAVAGSTPQPDQPLPVKTKSKPKSPSRALRPTSRPVRKSAASRRKS